jgi:hypothetical protein
LRHPNNKPIVKEYTDYLDDHQKRMIETKENRQELLIYLTYEAAERWNYSVTGRRMYFFAKDIICER